MLKEGAGGSGWNAPAGLRGRICCCACFSLLRYAGPALESAASRPAAGAREPRALAFAAAAAARGLKIGGGAAKML